MKAVIIQLVLLNVIHLVSGQSSSYDVSAPSLQGLEGRLFANEIRVIGLGQKLKSLKIRLKETADVRTVDKIINDVKRKVAALEGTGCATNQMQCGGDQRQCVSELLVCDGIKDCKNGRDEDPKFCDISHLHGMTFHWQETKRNPCRIFFDKTEYLCRASVISAKRSKIFKALVFLKSELSCASEPKIPLEIYYHNAHHWVGYAQFKTGECFFQDDDYNRATCTWNFTPVKADSTPTNCGEKVFLFRES